MSSYMEQKAQEQLEYSLQSQEQCFKLIDNLEKKLQLAEEALMFYADKYSWYLHKDKLSEVRRSIELSDTESFGVLLENGDNFLEVLAGKRAREYFTKIKEMEKSQ